MGSPRQFREYLEAHGYDTSQMGLREEIDTMASSESVTDEKKDAVSV